MSAVNFGDSKEILLLYKTKQMNKPIHSCGYQDTVATESIHQYSTCTLFSSNGYMCLQYLSTFELVKIRCA